MFHGLTMVNFDGQTQNQMMVRPWSAMVNHGRPWSDGQTVAGDTLLDFAFVRSLPLHQIMRCLGNFVIPQRKILIGDSDSHSE